VLRKTIIAKDYRERVLSAKISPIFRTQYTFGFLADALRRIAFVAIALGIVSACGTPHSASPTSSTDHARADAVMRVVRNAMAQAHLKAVIVRVTVDGKEIVTQAVGDSMTGVPATTDMHFRNGAVAISYVSTLLLKLVDIKKVSLDDTLSKWLPDFPNAQRVTLGQLAQMTAGYPDYVIGNQQFANELYANPFQQWTTQDILAQISSRPLLYDPGTNWNYAHTDYVLLGLALEKATGQDMPTLLQSEVLGPLGLKATANSETPEIPNPVLHAFSSERRQALKIPVGTPFYEESTYWNPSWTITHGAIQTTNIYDLEATAVGVGSGKLLSADSYKKMVSTALRGKTHTQQGCPTCLDQNEGYTYGLGIVTSGDWLMQNPLFAGYSAVEAYLPAQKVAIAVAVTYAPEAFDDQGNYGNQADILFRKIGAEAVPNDAPPMPPGR
jgi:CubicO group peptidase (beta-lactamase class C family)